MPLRIIPSNEDEPNKPAASEAVLWKQAEDDLTEAIKCNLPVTRVADEKGRIEKGAAIAMLAKVYLTQHKYPEAHYCQRKQRRICFRIAIQQRRRLDVGE